MTGTPDRKRPLWPLLTAALIGLPVLYVLSYGPWVRLSLTGDLPASVSGFGAAYSPIMPAVIESPEWVQTAYGEYLRIWLKGTEFEGLN